MLDGVVRFPAEFAARYRAKGYWQDRSLRGTFDEIFKRFSERVAIIDGEQAVTYAQLDQRATRLALNLLDEGLRPLDRVVVQLPNVVSSPTCTSRCRRSAAFQSWHCLRIDFGR